MNKNENTCMEVANKPVICLGMNVLKWLHVLVINTGGVFAFYIASRDQNAGTVGLKIN